MAKAPRLNAQVLDCESHPASSKGSDLITHRQRGDSLEKDIAVDDSFGQQDGDKLPIFVPVRRELAGRKIVRFEAVPDVTPGPDGVRYCNGSALPSRGQLGDIYQHAIDPEAMRRVKERVFSQDPPR